MIGQNIDVSVDDAVDVGHGAAFEVGDLLRGVKLSQVMLLVKRWRLKATAEKVRR